MNIFIQLILTMLLLLTLWTCANAESIRNEQEIKSKTRTFLSAHYRFEVTQGNSLQTIHIRIFNKTDASELFNKDVMIGMDADIIEKWLSETGRAPTATKNNYSAIIVLDDYNFDGFTDFSVLESSGTVQINRGVYMYNPQKVIFSRNEKLSGIPCLRVDPLKKRIYGDCFHSSASNNWVEVYSITGNDLLMTGRFGTDYIIDGERYYLFTFKAKMIGKREKIVITSCVEELTMNDKLVRRKVSKTFCQRGVR